MLVCSMYCTRILSTTINLGYINLTFLFYLPPVSGLSCVIYKCVSTKICRVNHSGPLGVNYSEKEVVTNYFRYIAFGLRLVDSHSVAWLLHNPVMSFLLPMFRIAGDEPPVASFPFTCPSSHGNHVDLVYMSYRSRACNADV